MSTETDGQLVARARAGDITAFEEIVDRHRAALVALAAARLGSVAEAEEVAQEAFVQAFFRLHQLRDPEALWPWLRRVAERVALMRLRARREEPVEPAEVERMHHGMATDPSEHGDAGDLLARLPEAMRRTVTLTYLAGYTCSEAAVLLGVQEGTVKSRLSRARAILKEAFEMTGNELSQGKPDRDFTEKTIARLMREARRLLRRGKLDDAAARTDQVLELQAKQLFACEHEPGFRFDEEAARISALAWKEQRRRDCEANAAQYGFKLEELDWELDDADMLDNTLGKPAGHGADLWGIPLSRMRILIKDSRDICRRLQCNLLQLHAWVQQGCPTLRCYPLVRFDPARVKQWLAANGIADWPKESDLDTGKPIRVIFRELHRGTITPEQAEEVVSAFEWG